MLESKLLVEVTKRKERHTYSEANRKSKRRCREHESFFSATSDPRELSVMKPRSWGVPLGHTGLCALTVWTQHYADAWKKDPNGICCLIVRFIYNNPPNKIHRVSSSRQTGLYAEPTRNSLSWRAALSVLQQVLQVLCSVCGQLLHVYTSSATVLTGRYYAVCTTEHAMLCILLTERRKGLY